MKTILQKKYSRLIPFLILACCLIAYYQVYSAGFIWDDEDYVINNPVLRDWFGLGQIWFKPTSLPQYYPLVHTIFWIQFQLWELNPFGYHLINVIIHGFNAILVFKILKDLELRWALFAALLFALHPVLVESVAWITELKNVLSGLFYLLALRFYLRWRPVINVQSSGFRFGILAFVFFICALASKTVTFSLPAAILLIVYWKRGSISKSDWIWSIPFFVVGILSALHTSFLERTHVKAAGPEFDFEFTERILIAGRALWFYVGKLFYPYPLSFNYTRWDIDSSSFLQWIYPLTFLVLLILLLLFRNKIGRGPLVATLFFSGTLLPALGFFNVFPMLYSFVADHFQYLASLGPLCLFAALSTNLTQSHVVRKIRSVFAGLVLLVLGTLTFQQAKNYEGLETLWRNTLEKNSSSWLSMNNLAKILIDRGDDDEALPLLKRSIEVRHSWTAHTNLGVLAYRRGEKEIALEHFEQAIALGPDQPAAYNNKAYILMNNGSLEEALIWVNKALVISDMYPDAIATRGQILYRLGRMKEAYTDLTRTIGINPGQTELLLLAGDAAYKLGDLDSALKWSANLILRSKEDVQAQSLLSKVLIQLVLKQTPENRVSYCQQMYSNIGAACRPCFIQLVKYFSENNLTNDANQISKALKL
jgi:protein O-mannosyl-transferase